MQKVIVLAIFLRLLVSAFFFHPDIKTYHFQASFLKRGVVDIYSYLVEHKVELPLKEEFVYFPLTYLTLGSYQALVTPFLGNGLDSWLGNADSNAVVSEPNIFKYLLVLKLPYLFLDLFVGLILYKFFKDREKAKTAMLIWLFNPFTIVLIYVFGNIDIIPTALTLVSFYSMERGRSKIGAIMLGIAAGFKLYPLLFLPFMMFYGKNSKEKVLHLMLPVLTFLLISIPFFSNAFVSSALISGLSTRIFNPGITIGFNETIIMSLFAISALFFWAYSSRDFSPIKYWTLLYLLIFAFSHFHIQWLIWVAPFLVILIVKNPRLRWLISGISIFAFLIPFLYEDRQMNVGLMRVYSTLFDSIPTPFSIVERFYDPFGLQSILHTVIAGAVVILVYEVLREKKYD